MSLRIGRFFSTTTDPSSIIQDGDLLSISFDIRPATLAQANAERQQILGIVDNEDEPVIPVTWDQDATIDGYYRPLSASVEPTEAFLLNRLMRASVSLERVKNGYANPAIETYVVSRTATNSHSIVSPSYRIAISHPRGSASIQLDRTTLPNATLLRRHVGEYGEIDNYYDFTGGDFAGFSVAYSAPSEYYTNDCRIRDANGVITGSQMARLGAGGTWTISNGFVSASSTANDNELSVGGWDTGISAYDPYLVRSGTISGSAFSASGSHSITGAGVAPVILKNSPELVSVRVFNGIGEPSFTFTLWRGSLVLIVTVDSPQAPAFSTALGLGLSIAATNITGGARTTANNANGNRLAIFNRAAVTTSTTSFGVAATTPATRSVFGVAVQRDGSTAISPWTDSHLLQQFCAPPQWQQRVAAR